MTPDDRKPSAGLSVSLTRSFIFISISSNVKARKSFNPRPISESRKLHSKSLAPPRSDASSLHGRANSNRPRDHFQQDTISAFGQIRGSKAILLGRISRFNCAVSVQAFVTFLTACPSRRALNTPPYHPCSHAY